MSSVSMQKFDLEALHWRSSTDRQSTWPRVIFGLFGDIFTLNADYIAWKLLKMALEVEYMMEYQHPGLTVTDLHLRSSTDRQSTWPRVIFGPLFVCLFVCEQDNSKTDRWILIKFSGYVQNAKRKIWLNFGSDPDHCLDLLDPWNLIFKDR